MTGKAIFIGPAFPYKGGIAAFNESLASTFQSKGWECKIFTFSDQYPFASKDKLTTEDPNPDLSISRGIYSANPLNWLKISKEIVKEKPDLLITQYWMPFMAPAFGTILRGVKKELPSVNIATIVHSFKPDQARIGGNQLNKYLTNRTDHLVCLSQGVLDQIKSIAAEKSVAKLFHPVYDHYGDKVNRQVAREKLGWDKNEKQILFFGEVKPSKGLDMLIEALGTSQHKNEMRLQVSGQFLESQKKYEKLIDKAGISNQITLSNSYIPNDQVPLLFCAADVVAMPYKLTTHSGILPLALHFEVPVIMTSTVEMAAEIRNEKLGYVCDGSSACLSQAIDDFVTEKYSLSSDYGAIKKSFSWDSFYDRFLSTVF